MPVQSGRDDLTGQRIAEQHRRLQVHCFYPGGEAICQLIDRKNMVRPRAVAKTWKIRREHRVFVHQSLRRGQHVSARQAEAVDQHDRHSAFGWRACELEMKRETVDVDLRILESR